MDERTFHTALLYGWTAFALVPALMLVFVTDAPYGKFFRAPAPGAPKRWWTLPDGGRWGWIVQEVVSPVALLWFWWNAAPGYTIISSDSTMMRHMEGTPASASSLTYVYATLWIAHYIHRTFIYTWCAPSMNGTSVPIVVAAMFFNLINGYLNGAQWRLFPTALLDSDDKPLTAATMFRMALGLALFGVGMAVNVHSDHTLFRLRRETMDRSAREMSMVEGRTASKTRTHGKKATTSPKKTTRYVIPRGGMFEYVSAANYLGEIVEWLGFTILTASPAAASFLLWTVANLGPRAFKTHRWYHDTFGKAYPSERRALIPYLF